jgi:type III secretion protein K
MLAKLLTRVAAAAAEPEPQPVPQPEPRGPRDLLRLVVSHNLDPHLGLHPSWLPPHWPARHRRISAWGPAGQAVLGALVRGQHGGAPDYQFDSRLKRLMLMDAAALRRLAVYTGLGAHRALLEQGTPAGSQLRRQARRYDRDAMRFTLQRMPALPQLRMELRAMQERPLATGRLLVSRGYRLLLGALATEGEEGVRRVRHKFPRRLAALSVPALQPRQTEQLSELMLSCIVPERLPQWDWLF